jgi:hypothetical protein
VTVASFADRVVDDAEFPVEVLSPPDADAVVVAAARSRRIRGLDDAALAGWEDRAEAAMAAALAEVMDAIAAQIARAAGVASGVGDRVRWAGCFYCLNPRHPGPCAKPKAADGPDPKGHGSGGGGGSGAHGEEGSMRPSLRDAKTTDEVSAVVAAEASSITGRQVRCDMTGSDPQIAREHGEAVLQDLEMFPQAQVSSIRTYGPGSRSTLHSATDAYAVTRHGNLDEIAFNTEFAGNPEKYRASLKSNAETGWLSVPTPAGVAHHEFGHVVAHHTATATASKKHVTMKAKAAGVKPSALARDQISDYAVTNPHELAAEAFADVVTRGGDASPLSQDIFALIDGGYRYQAGELV